MAFRVASFRLPDEYIAAIADIAGKEEESQGFIIQQALYSMLNGSLPIPRRRDEAPRRKTERVRRTEDDLEGASDKLTAMGSADDQTRPVQVD